MNNNIRQRISKRLLVWFLHHNTYIYLTSASGLLVIIRRGHYHLEIIRTERLHSIDGDVELLKCFRLMLVPEAEENEALLVGHCVRVVDEELLVPGGMAAFDHVGYLEVSFFGHHFII